MGGYTLEKFHNTDEVANMKIIDCNEPNPNNDNGAVHNTDAPNTQEDNDIISLWFKDVRKYPVMSAKDSAVLGQRLEDLKIELAFIWNNIYDLQFKDKAQKNFFLRRYCDIDRINSQKDLLTLKEQLLAVLKEESKSAANVYWQKFF